MGKMDISERIKKGIQPGLVNPMMNKPEDGGSKNNLLSPSFDDVMNKKPDETQSVDKHAIGTRPSLMNKFNKR